MMNTKKIGKKLEIMIANKLQEIFKENPPIRPTKSSSGGSHNTEIADLQSKNFYVECKNDGNWFKKKIWNKLINSLPLGTTKIPMYVINDEQEGLMVCLSFSDLYSLIKRGINNEI